jgi:hypothetical protein
VEVRQQRDGGSKWRYDSSGTGAASTGAGAAFEGGIAERVALHFKIIINLRINLKEKSPNL